jgi:hypothetical protein
MQIIPTHHAKHLVESHKFGRFPLVRPREASTMEIYLLQLTITSESPETTHHAYVVHAHVDVWEGSNLLHMQFN